MNAAMGAELLKVLIGIWLFASFGGVHTLVEGEVKPICVYHDTKYTCDCAFSNEPIELPSLDGNIFHISIMNCKNIFVFSNFLSKTFGLRSISFTNLENLTLESHALEFPPRLSSNRLIIGFNNVSINEIQPHVFNGNIDEITFNTCRIDLIQPFAFAAINYKANFLKFIDTIIKMIEPQAFKKFSVDRFEITNCLFMSPLGSRTFNDIDVEGSFTISNSSFMGAFSRAFSFSGLSMLRLVGNQFYKFEGECFDIKIADNVVIKNNTFTDIHPALFREIQVTPSSMQRSEKLEFRLFDNSIQQTNGPVPLYLSDNFQIELRKLYYVTNADCDQINQLAKTVFFVRFGDSIYFRFSQNDQYVTFNEMLHKNCVPYSPWLYVGLGMGGLIILAIIVALLAIYFIRKKRKTRLNVVTPEPRTYRETQIVMQVESHGLLKTDM